MSRNRINRLSLSPDPPATNTAASIKYNSGLVRQQQERNSPSYQSYKKVCMLILIAHIAADYFKIIM